jgi:hypothetical protein
MMTTTPSSAPAAATCLAARIASVLLLLSAVPCQAQNPETVEGLGPGAGDWELEYVGQVADANGSDDERQHSGQSFYGVNEWLAVGGETQLSYRSGPLVREDRLYFGYDSAAAIIRFSDAEDDPLGLGLWLQAGLDSDGELARLEARLIAEKKAHGWWAQGNLLLRRMNEGAQEGAYVAYAARLSRALGPSSWLGVEASGQAAELSGFRRESLDKGHFVGPSLTREFSLGADDRLELGLSWLHRLDNHDGARNFFQVTAALKL